MKLIEKLVSCLQEIEGNDLRNGKADKLEHKISNIEIKNITELVSETLVKNEMPFQKNIDTLLRNGFGVSPKEVDTMGWHTAILTTSKGWIEFDLKPTTQYNHIK